MILGQVTTGTLEWDRRMYGLALEAASWSKDPVRKVGSVVVSADRRRMSPGYNGFPRGTPDVKQHLMDETMRQMLMVHGEVNSIINAGFDVEGCTLYATKYPCHACAGIMANSRIARLVCPAPDYDNPKWGESYRVASEVLANASVEVDRCDS
jgi:dCMP deaminase